MSGDELQTRQHQEVSESEYFIIHLLLQSLPSTVRAHYVENRITQGFTISHLINVPYKNALFTVH